MSVNGEIESALRRNFQSPADFVLAVSGGPDSQALLKAFPHVARKLGHGVRAHGVDHGLRPEAPAELELARRLAEQSGVPFATTRLSLQPGPNVQARARDARYSALWAHDGPRQERESPGRPVLVTAHHADDRAETVLIRLLRGSGSGSMAVLPELSRLGPGRSLFRPLLSVRREELLAYCRRWSVPYATDPSNSDERYLRVWIRKRLMPLMAERSPRIVEKLCHVADDLVRARAASPERVVFPDEAAASSEEDEGILSDLGQVESFLTEVDESVASSVMEG